MVPRTIALTRAVSRSIERCALTHLDRTPIDLARASAQHAAYQAALRELGCEVLQLAEEPALPDAVFVEDGAVVVAELAVITRPGAAERRAELPSLAAALARHRPLAHIRAPGTLDGGDVLQLGRRLFVGRSARSNEAGRRQLTRALEPFGYSVHGVPLGPCLHLKSAACALADGLVLLNRAWVDPAAFGAVERIEVAPEEPFAANAVAVGGAILHPEAFARTRQRLLAHGLTVRPVPADELAKAEGGVSCCSVLVPIAG